MKTKSTTKTISCRLEESIVEQINQLAKGQGLSPSVWIRQQIMEALYGVTEADVSPVTENAAPTIDVQRPVEDLQQVESRLTRQFEELQRLIDKANCDRREDMATLAQLKLNAEKATQSLILDAGAELLLAIERLKQSQRSHKDTLLQAIDDLNPTEHSRTFPHAG